MATMATISLDEKYKDKIQKGFDLFKKLELSLSSYDKNAKLYQLNKKREIKADKYFLNILQKSKYYYKHTDGYFDVSIGSITKDLYCFGQSNERLPSKDELNNAKINIQGVHVKERIITLSKGIKLDFGGIAKGYSVDEVAQYYKDQNITKGKVALSGDIRCMSICRFHIQSPFAKNRTFATFDSKTPNLSISTSGTYERYIKSQEYHHLINPKTKRQGRVFASVTILANANNTKTDVLATATSVMSEKQAIDFLLTQDVGFILIKYDKTIISSNLSQFVHHIK